MQEIYASIVEILGEILDLDPTAIRPESYVMRDLGAESIDLMELAVSINERFAIEVDEEAIFLKSLRPAIETGRCGGGDPAAAVAEKYVFLESPRIDAMLADLTEGPVLQVQDLVRYVRYHTPPEGSHAG